MAVKRFSGSFKARTDILDNITPNNVVQPNVSVPAGEWKPANWLPVIWQGEASQDNFVISSGKIVCMTTEGRVVSARYRWLAENAAAGDTALTYTQLDVDQGTTNVTTGSAVTQAEVNAGGTVTMTALADGLLDRGLVLEADLGLAGDVNTSQDADCQAALLAFVSAPVGVCAYDVYAWAGDAPGELNFVNYQKQHLIQFFTDVQLQVPVHALHADPSAGAGGALEEQTATQAAFAAWTGLGGDGITFPDAGIATNGLLLTSTQLHGLGRYSASIAAGDDVVGIAIPNAPICSSTSRTPISDSSTALIKQKSSVSKVTKAGDFFVDTDVGVIIAGDGGGGGAAPGGVFTADITYNIYADGSGNGAAGERFVHMSGVPRPGTHVTYDINGNFEPISMDGDNFDKSVGRCLGTVRQPAGLLDRVRTAWEGSSFDKTAQMPGTATAGFTDLITLSDEGASDLVALINVKVQ